MRRGFVILLLLFVSGHAAAAQEGTHVRVRLKSGEELVGRILRKEPESLTFAAEAGNQVNIRELANSEIESVTRITNLLRTSNVAEFARRLPPGAAVRLQLASEEKLEGKFLRVTGQDLDLDLSRGREMAFRLVPFSGIRQIQMKAPRSGRPAILALAPTLIFLGLRVAQAF